MALDLTKKKFGRLTTLSRAPGTSPTGSLLWNCVCDCGGTKICASVDLVHNRTKSCGCLLKEKWAMGNPVHGHAKGGVLSPEYTCYRTMHQRCRNPNDKCAHLYYLKGIRVCGRWSGKGGFIRFLSDMGRRPSPKHSLEREKNGENYSPENCRWATAKEQARNISTNRFATIDGQTKCLSEWAEHFGISYPNMHNRVRLHDRHGLSVESAILDYKNGIRFKRPA